MQSALLSVLATKYFNRDLQKAATEFAAEAVADYIFEISFDARIRDEVKQKILGKLLTIKLWVAFPPNVLNQKLVDEFHDELELDGSESFVTMLLQMKKFGRKLDLERKWNPFGRSIDDGTDLVYNFERNILGKLSS